MPTDGSVTVAIAQHPPVVLNLEESLRRAVDHIADAARAGAGLVVFPEAWLTCYPAWVFGRAGWNDPVAKSWYGRLLDQSPVVGGAEDYDDGISRLRRAAREHQITVVMGLNERAGVASGTLYNSLATITPDGRLANLHRKLTPTHTERIVWAQGDAEGLRVVDTPVGRVGGLICWEHWHPLARQALHLQDEQLHVAAWPDVPEMHHVAARAYAFEGRCFVLCAGQYLTSDDVPSDLLADYRAGVGPDAPEAGVLFDGGSGIVGPDGSWLVGPVVGEPRLIVAKVPLSAASAEKLDLDVGGHYSRRDVFELTVDRRRRSGVIWVDEAAADDHAVMNGQ